MKGSKPDFHGAMAGDDARILYEQFLENLTKEYQTLQAKLQMQTTKTAPVFPGAFGQYMNIEIVNDGPCTLIIDSIKDPKAVKKLEARLDREKKTEMNRQKQIAETQMQKKEVNEVKDQKDADK